MMSVVYLLIPTSNHNININPIVSDKLYIFWFLHQTTTAEYQGVKSESCISFDSYIKPQPAGHRMLPYLVVYLLIPTSNHNYSLSYKAFSALYIFWFLHQTTTLLKRHRNKMSCISFDSYIKPQRMHEIKQALNGCISFDSYIKPQHWIFLIDSRNSCTSFDSYIKPQPYLLSMPMMSCCISFDSYIKPQPRVCTFFLCEVVYLLIPTSNHNSFVFGTLAAVVVYLLIPTSNHNLLSESVANLPLYIFWFLHQTTTIAVVSSFMLALYIFWFLHQTTTISPYSSP